jgi:hypothetical protein
MKDRASIIDSVSNWIKLLALIILVGEAILLAAMSQTPVESEIYPWYPFIMIFLLLVIVVALFFDRYQDKKTKQLKISVDDRELSVNASSAQIPIKASHNSYSNSMAGYSFNQPKGDNWGEPTELTFSDLTKKLLGIEHLDEEQFKANLQAGSTFGNLMYHSKTLETQYGETYSLNLDEGGTTVQAEYLIEQQIELSRKQGHEPTEEEIEELRKRFNKTDEFPVIRFYSALQITTFNKETLSNKTLPAGLQTIFFTIAAASHEPLESLEANQDLITWTTTNTLKNVYIEDEKFNTFHIYRYYQLRQNQKNFMLCTIQWSPQLDANLSIWETLKKSFESFSVHNA